MNESVKVTLAGRMIEWGKLDELACGEGLHGGDGRELSLFDGEYPRQYGYGRAVEGACGCIRSCMVHLEQSNKLTKTFRNPFRKPGWKQWKVDHAKPYEIPPEVVAEYGLDKPQAQEESDAEAFNPLND